MPRPRNDIGSLYTSGEVLRGERYCLLRHAVQRYDGACPRTSLQELTVPQALWLRPGVFANLGGRLSGTCCSSPTGSLPACGLGFA